MIFSLIFSNLHAGSWRFTCRQELLFRLLIASYISIVAQGDEAIAQGDWPQWGGNGSRNMVSAAPGIPMEWDVESRKNILWSAKLGSQNYGNPVVAGGKVFVGTNNATGFRAAKHPAEEDRGCVVALDEKTGKFLWQLTREKLDRVEDWPEMGVCSTACVVGDLLYVVTNRCEVVCLDVNGFQDGKNNGPYQSEVDAEKEDADIVWLYDMRKELRVYPHNMATCSPTVHEDYLFVVTSNGVDDTHERVAAPEAPSFLCLHRHTGKVIWQDASPGEGILHGQWSSPALGEVDGKMLVFFPGGDGWIYAFDVEASAKEGKGKLVWKYDLNPKDAKHDHTGRGDRSEIIGTPVFFEGSIVSALGQDPEHGDGVGHIHRIDAAKQGDITDSGRVWHFGGGTGEGRKKKLNFRRTISTVAIHNGLVFAPDLTGFLHCIDFKTGERYWEYDMLSAIWGSPMVIDGKVYLGDEDGDVVIFAADKKQQILGEQTLGAPVYSTPIVANGVLFIAARGEIFAIAAGAPK
jgi:outer membrane protein assembly factor BamB